MDMSVERKSIQGEQLLGCCREQITVAGDVSLPGSLRDTVQILYAGAMASVESAAALQDRISITGRVIFRVVYLRTGQQPEALEATADFTHGCTVKGVQPGAEVYACAQAGPVNAAVQGGRAALTTQVLLQARACSNVTMDVIAGIGGAQQQTRPVTLRLKTASGSAEHLLREEFALPADLAVTDTLTASAWAECRETSGGQGRIGLSGEVVIEAVHASSQPGQPLVVTRHAVPISHGIEVHGDIGPWLDGRITVKDVAVASQEAGDGERTLRAEVLLGLSAWADQEAGETLLADAYTTAGEDVRLTRETRLLRTGVNRVHAAESGRAALLLPEGAPPLRKVLAAFAEPVMTSHEQQGGRHTAEGRLHTTLIYQTAEDAIASVQADAPFRVMFAMQAGGEDILHLTASEVEAAPLTADRAELRYILRLEADGLQIAPVSLVTETAAVAGETPTSDIVLYFAQPGESSWDIAKRYRLPESDLLALNPGMGENLASGQGLVVWRRA